MESTSEKKWYIVEQGSSEDNSFFLIQATKDEFLFLRKVLKWAEDEDMELEYSPLSGYMKVYPEGFNTASEAKKVFTEIYREYKGVYYDE